MLFVFLQFVLLHFVSSQTGVSNELAEDDYRAPASAAGPTGTILVLGGQGLAGSATLNSLLQAGFKVTAVNNNKNYYDYSSSFEDKIESVACIRTSGLDGCFELQNFIKSNKKVRAIVDFTSSKPELMEEAARILKSLEPEVYIFVSSAAVYDVSEETNFPVKEEAGVRPIHLAKQEEYKQNNIFGDNMMGAEEALVASGLPYVILRCGDLVGSRDTTYRWWQYQVWAEHFDVIDTPFHVPEDLRHQVFSLTYGEDVGQAVTSAIQRRVTGEVFNIALTKSFTLPHLLLEICSYFGKHESCYADFTQTRESSYNLYPSNHQGPLSIEKAKRILGFQPTSWEEVLRNTVKFYEDGRETFAAERNTILTRLNENVVPYLKMEALNKAVVTQTNGGERNSKTFTKIEL